MEKFVLSSVFMASLLVVSSTPVEGIRYKLICSPEPIVAAPGDDVILPCQVEPKLNVEGLPVEWSDPDLKPDPRDRLKRVDFVHLYRHYKEDPNMQLEAYRGRTMLFKDDLKHGNISLKIFNVSEEDQGRYRCLIPKLGGQTQSSIISLVIDSAKTRTTKTPLGLIIPQSSKESGKPEDLGKRQDCDHQKWLVPVVVLSVFLVLGFHLYKFSVSKKKSGVPLI